MIDSFRILILLVLFIYNLTSEFNAKVSLGLIVFDTMYFSCVLFLPCNSDMMSLNKDILRYIKLKKQMKNHYEIQAQYKRF